ncbi:hypothetical protein AX16_010221 [Volvariella volvacea WC 439]|nr:hypothetical protein AX16_010221 [Volvariella volvacea WC 439]
MDPETQTAHLLAPTVDDVASVKVFPLIPALKGDVIVSIAQKTASLNTADVEVPFPENNCSLTWQQLTASDINFSIVRPLVNRYARLKNMAVVYACFVVRSYFQSQAASDLAFSGVMRTRAMMCELLAIKLLSRFASNYIQLVAVLTTAWNPLAGAPQEVLDEVRQTLRVDDDEMNSPRTALEMAISTKAKEFLSSPVSQKVVNDIYSGHVVFSVAGTRSVLADNYKPRAIEIYDSRKAPLLDHYRLRVPRYGAILEFLNFVVLLLTFVLCLSNRDLNSVTPWECAFIIMASAFALEEYTAASEHGWIIYIASIWNAFDFLFNIIFVLYLGLRIKGLSDGNVETSTIAFDILSCGACILFPRLAFFAISNNVVILSLRVMISQFVFFIGIAAVCFSGLLFTLWTLSKDNPTEHERWTMKSIAWLMVQIWFGNVSLSFAQASSFHPLFGPILMIGFAALSNTLLLTILISILSNTVARIDAKATQEYLFQFAISTIEGVKSDALFSYQPPFNILAFLILKPASFVLTPRALHTLNVFLIKFTNLPVLLLISLYERHLAEGQEFRESSIGAAQTLFNSLPRHIKNIPFIEAIVGSTASNLYDVIFDVDVDHDLGLWEDEEERADETFGTLRSLRSRDNLRAEASGEQAEQRRRSPSSARENGSRRPRSTPRSPAHREREAVAISASGSPRLVITSALPPSDSQEGTGGSGLGASGSGPISPLARLFGNRFPSSGSGLGLLSAPNMIGQVDVVEATQSSLKRMEGLIEDVKNLPVQKLKDEMKELQGYEERRVVADIPTHLLDLDELKLVKAGNTV